MQAPFESSTASGACSRITTFVRRYSLLVTGRHVQAMPEIVFSAVIEVSPEPWQSVSKLAFCQCSRFRPCVPFCLARSARPCLVPGVHIRGAWMLPILWSEPKERSLLWVDWTSRRHNPHACFRGRWPSNSVSPVANAKPKVSKPRSLPRIHSESPVAEFLDRLQAMRLTIQRLDPLCRSIFGPLPGSSVSCIPTSSNDLLLSIDVAFVHLFSVPFCSLLPVLKFSANQPIVQGCFQLGAEKKQNTSLAVVKPSSRNAFTQPCHFNSFSLAEMRSRASRNLVWPATMSPYLQGCV